jgi:hypothetical protein
MIKPNQLILFPNIKLKYGKVQQNIPNNPPFPYTILDWQCAGEFRAFWTQPPPIQFFQMAILPNEEFQRVFL